MVGVPGKSKGCHTCRRRRVKCDLGQPNCARCTKIGKVCEGYERGLVFLNRTATGLEKRKGLEEALPRKSSESTILGNNIEGIADGSCLADMNVEAQRVPPQIDGKILIVKRYESLFLEDFLPSDPRRGGNILGLWLLESVCAVKPNRALDCANEALFLTRVGRMNGDSSTATQGRLRYGQALREVQRALLDKIEALRDETLAACQALSLYETLESSGSAVRGQKNHLQGIVKLLKHRQSIKSQSALSVALTDYFYYTTMVLCIQQRSLAAFGNLGGKASIWPYGNTIEQKLYDKGFLLAATFEAIDRTLDTETISERGPRITALVDRCQKLDQELDIWYAELLEAAKSKHTWQAFLPQLQNQTQEPIAFPDLRLAHILLCFWALRMVLTLTLVSLHKMRFEAQDKTQDHNIDTGSQQTTSDSMERESRGGYQTQQGPPVKEMFGKATYYADLIVRGLPYVTREEMGIASWLRSIFGLRGALGVFRFTRNLEKVRYCEEVVAMLTTERGISFAADIARQSARWGDTKERYP
ncbi:uncharacterized protein LY89DRAFT_740268 [Mollisia scopiformis]|uniref:Zn(2)-C6 fungal-type domain-containing protein n=1 Tax=Mollisia scopiformis TaxID=149040 RepID=A0A132BEW2_MOLSC|nr:uncharacterized protein LY89DRAFT_740268 [Mollisia scopiformis]KUJ10559.1 hypothetical protein LY89DRAFT_740268 [Mollisia scopiformis]